MGARLRGGPLRIVPDLLRHVSQIEWKNVILYAATRSKSPIGLSIPRSNRVPVFDVIAPPSNAAVTFRPWYP